MMKPAAMRDIWNQWKEEKRKMSFLRRLGEKKRFLILIDFHFGINFTNKSVRSDEADRSGEDPKS